MIKIRFSKIFLLMGIWALASGCSGTRHFMLSDGDRNGTQTEIRYDVDGNGMVDFALRADARGIMSILAYDDNEDGQYDRIYNVNDYATEDVPHLIILLDSIPYQCVVDKYRAGHFKWFPPPQKVISPFPSLTDVAYNRLLHAPPRAGTNNLHYDHRTNRKGSNYWDRIQGNKRDWQCFWTIPPLL
jgi:hypothetical protein